ncbi:ribonuclease D [Serinibacter salmoneus]|uniref:Ribonuclease D n=1 Tax=Serinibacter salmoneus TaxID=556530 RepID=A0A2A9CZY3_9MICO|nr:HRDC domain-containing protein [Serinibacter salmoneus]PFG19565.1 ribonuclease D [Serinibacter salmoneus]
MAEDTRAATGQDVEPLLEPREGVPAVITTQQELHRYAQALAAGSGSVAVDAERASGFRYSQRAYLVQLRRAGAGTALVDPIALPDLSVLNEALRGVEWVLHAANQDLECLREVGMTPDALFDTELAGRILGRDRVGLGAIVAAELGLGLAKEHSAADWSTRPLPENWLRYAALDVEVLVDLRDALHADLESQGKWAWAEQEFEHVRTLPPPAARVEPWRRLSRITTLRGSRAMAVARELWYARDEVARERDTAPGRILPDRAIVAAAAAMPRDRAGLARLPEFSGRGTRRRVERWWAAVARAQSLPEQDLPSRRGPRTDDMPASRSWAPRFPEEAERLRAVRATLRRIAGEVGTPQENVLTPDTQRRIAWDPPSPVTAEAVGERLRVLGARAWQTELTAPAIAAALRDPASVPDDAA